MTWIYVYVNMSKGRSLHWEAGFYEEFFKKEYFKDT